MVDFFVFYKLYDIFYWNIHPEVKIEIILYNQRDEVYVSFPNVRHDHIEVDDLLKYLYSLNEEGWMIVIKRGLFRQKKKIYFDKNIIWEYK